MDIKNMMMFIAGEMKLPPKASTLDTCKLMLGKKIQNNKEGIEEVIYRIKHHPNGSDLNTEPIFEYLVDEPNRLFRIYFDYDEKGSHVDAMPDEEFKDHCHKINNENIQKLNEHFNQKIDLSISSYNGYDKSHTTGKDYPINKTYGKKKVSFHYIISNLKTTQEENKRIAGSLGFDTSVYGKKQLFRFGKTHKYKHSIRYKKDGKGHRCPKLLTNKKDLEKHIIQYLPDYCIEWKPNQLHLPPPEKEEGKEEEEETNGDEEKEKESGVKKGHALWGLPYEYVDDYGKWLEITLYFKQFGSYEDWCEWNKLSKRYHDSWVEENKQHWESRPAYSGDGRKAIDQITNPVDKGRLQTLFHIYNGLVNDKNCVDDIIQQFKEYFRVVDYKKDDIYYFNRDSNLWVKTNKDYLNCYLSRYYYPDLNELDFQVRREEVKQEGDTIKSEWFGKCVSKEAYEKKKSIFHQNINNQGNTKTKNNFIKEFFLRDYLKDEKFKEKLNKDKHILSVKGGKVDLKSGKWSLRAYDDYISYELDLEYDKAVDSNEAWLSFLRDILTPVELNDIKHEYNQALDYLHRYLGYCITGETREEKILVLMGEGSNGKSKFFSMLQQVLKSDVNIVGSWEADLFNENVNSKNVNSASPEIAKLYGKRLGFINESKNSMVWGETFKKLVDTGSSLPARELYGSSFEFDLTTSFLMCSNEFPNFPIQNCYIRRVDTLSLPNRYCDMESRAEKDITNNDKAIDIRLMDSICKTERNKQGILNWLIEGAKAYYEGGLMELPNHQKEQKEKYISGNDWFSRFEFTGNRKDFVVVPEIYQSINTFTKCKVDKKDMIQKFLANGAEIKRKLLPDGRKLNILRNFRNKIELEEDDEDEEYGLMIEEEDSPLDVGIEKD